MVEKYTLPELGFEKDALEPHMSEEQLTIHHDRHHQGYVNNSNNILREMEDARNNGEEIDMNATLKAFSFNLAGHILHSMFWKNLKPVVENAEDNAPTDDIFDAIKVEYGDIDKFKKEFSSAAKSVEGSGWAVLAFDKLSKRPIIMQIEKHNQNMVPSLDILMVLDVWEHAYYVDYRNDRGKYIDAFWKILDWEEVNRRFNRVSEK